MNKIVKWGVFASALVIAGGVGMVIMKQDKAEWKGSTSDMVHEKYESLEDLLRRFNSLAEKTCSQESADRNAGELYALSSFIRATFMLWHNQPETMEVASLREHPELLEKMAREEERFKQNNYFGSTLLSLAYGREDITKSEESSVDSNYVYLLLQQKLGELSYERLPLEEAVYRLFILNYEMDLYRKAGYELTAAETDFYNGTSVRVCSRLIEDPAYRDNKFLINLLRSRPIMPRVEPSRRSRGPEKSRRKP